MISSGISILGAVGGLMMAASTLQAGPPDLPPTPPGPVSPWEFRLEPYLWASGISGTTGVLGAQIPTDLSFKNIFHNLKMTYAGEFEVRYNRWGLLLDIFYADIGG